MKKIIGHYRLCDCVTMLGTSFSLLGIVFLFNSHFTTAVICMMLSGICDAFDGPLARRRKNTKQESAYGEQMDSLSDVVCFGMFPAIFTIALSNYWITYIICIFYMLCGVIRLAYFNMLNITKESKKGKFIGVPITMVSILYPLLFIVFKIINFNLLKYVMPITLLVLGVSYIFRFEFPKPNVIEIAKKIMNKYVVNIFLFPLLLLIGSDVFFRLSLVKINLSSFVQALENEVLSISHHFLSFLLIYLFIVALFWLFTAIFKKSKITKKILSIITLIIVVINDIKFNIMEMPIELSDINYLNSENMSMASNASHSLGLWILGILLKVFIFGLLMSIFIKTDDKKGYNIEKIKSRIIYIILSLIILVGIILGINNYSEFYLDKIYNAERSDILKINSNNELYDEYGFYNGIVLDNISKKLIEPTEYSKERVEEILSFYDNKKNNASWGKANVVFILSEAFSDINNVSEVKFNKEIMPNINRYKNENDKMVMDLIVPSYGGASVNTEFEVLTGSSLNFFKAGFIPYTQYYNEYTGKVAPNIIREFNNNGYETMYLTPWGKNSYKSEYVYTLFGADKKIYGNDLKGKKKGDWYSDKSLMEDIYNELKDTKKGKYKFIMAATGENHYPYTEDKFNKYDIKVKKSSLNKEDTSIIKSYAQGIYDADKELNNLYEMIKKIKTPTIIVFYGDHLPYTADSKKYDPYLESNYFKTTDKNLFEIKKHTTKAVILANYRLKTEKIDTLNASYLGAYTLNKLDIKTSNYFKFVDDTRKVVPAFNRNVIYSKNSTELINISDYKKVNAIQKYKNVQYNRFYDNDQVKEK